MIDWHWILVAVFFSTLFGYVLGLWHANRD
jgi:hypothetical protein